MSKISAKIKEEIEALIPPTVFFFGSLLMIGLVRALLLRGTGIAPTTPLEMLLAALVLAKAVLLADLWPAINRYPDKPLVYNVLWKTLIYSAVATLLHYLERLIDFWREAGSFMAANRLMLAKIVWAHFWAIEIIIIVLVLDYCVITEFARALGPKKLRQMFFGSPSLPGG
jgi:hypothetical protein